MELFGAKYNGFSIRVDDISNAEHGKRLTLLRDGQPKFNTGERCNHVHSVAVFHADYCGVLKIVRERNGANNDELALSRAARLFFGVRITDKVDLYEE